MELSEKQGLFAREYGDLFDFVYRYVRYRVPHLQEAEDVVADVITKAYTKLDVFDPLRGTLRQWLCGMAKHGIQMHWRGRRDAFSLDDVPESIEGLVWLPDTTDINHRLVVDRIVRNLPAETKALLAMRFEDDMTYQEIADMLGKDAAAVRKCFSRWLQKLQLTVDDDVYV